jgi:hypothetical protein
MLVRVLSCAGVVSLVGFEHLVLLYRVRFVLRGEGRVGEVHVRLRLTEDMIDAAACLRNRSKSGDVSEYRSGSITLVVVTFRKVPLWGNLGHMTSL